MIKRFSVYCGLVAAVLLQACRPDTASSFSHQYFDMNGLLKSQEQQLQGYSIQKNSTLDGHTDTQTLPADWSKEFDLFKEIDLNKPSWQGGFRVESTPNQVCYFAENQNINVKKLCVTYSSKHLPAHVWAQIAEDNMLYTSGREMHLYFDTTQTQTILRAYGMSGFQKVLLKDTMRYKVQAVLVGKKP
ncbi:hypothetical protein SAMN05421780_101313 [Flexibacter flexilis DSM 6793]|uniref:Lipoprotein n=1 Tax=Flexibacter flexilis DSM 6793 TaxID=927664 RepID=A0A1I1DT06_9BACT|nr:hypothetical protein [Flexibacter flexilis]SFB75850.1 hypothetical protein SAMN05421780_101313 [Flexibacter flexilis DSM 6793]